MPSETVDLAALLCSRLCHDMLSPVGALSNGIELLRDERDPEMRHRCMELLEQSARISADKLKFFRLAYGAAGGFGDTVPTQEPRDLVQGLVGDNGRIVLQWAVAEGLARPCGAGDLPTRQFCVRVGGAGARPASRPPTTTASSKTTARRYRSSHPGAGTLGPRRR